MDEQQETGGSNSRLLLGGDELPWGVKQLKLSLGGEDDCNGWIKIQIFHDRGLDIYINEHHKDGPDWCCEEIDLEAARLLRDFLNYAVP